MYGDTTEYAKIRIRSKTYVH